MDKLLWVLVSFPGLNISIGQNLAWDSSNWGAAIDMWHSEVANFEYGVGGDGIGHFTQVSGCQGPILAVMGRENWHIEAEKKPACPHVADAIFHDDVIKWKHFPRNWSFVRGMNSPHKGQWCGALMFSLICVWINGWVNNREAGDLRRHRGHYDDVNVMLVW